MERNFIFVMLIFEIVLIIGCVQQLKSKLQNPTISNIIPTSGQVGTEVTISGSGFTQVDNTVSFSKGYANDLPSRDGKTLRLIVPEELIPCPPSENPCVRGSYLPVTTGSYKISVINANGVSNSLTFTVTESKVGFGGNPICESDRDCKADEICTDVGPVIRNEEKKVCWPKGRPMPICLSGNIYIDTPNGAIKVKDLRQGMKVWTTDSSGARRAETILKTARTLVPSNHKVIHLKLADGRELFASPSHPMADGRLLADVSIGDLVDGVQVAITELVPYYDEFTYDILPSGETRTYFANGILLKSTMK